VLAVKRLTPREADALALLRRGASYKQGAAALGVGLARWKNLTRAVYGAYGVQSQVQLLALFAGELPRREPGDVVLYG
jgi:DNA-binding CsgD family transcriptional regulator